VAYKKGENLPTYINLICVRQTEGENKCKQNFDGGDIENGQTKA